MESAIAKDIRDYNSSRLGEDKAICELLAAEISAHPVPERKSGSGLQQTKSGNQAHVLERQ